MTFVTWVAYVQKTYTKQVWSIVYLFLGFVRTSCTVNDGSTLPFLINLSVKEPAAFFHFYYERTQIYFVETAELGKEKRL